MNRVGTVLIVEDETILLDVTTIMLRQAGYTVLVADSPQAALKSINQNVDLLLSDIALPDISGIELFETLRLSYPALKAVFVSGYPADLVVETERLPIGVVFIEKPFDRDELLSILSAVLQSS